jgi:hypothetical protein
VGPGGTFTGGREWTKFEADIIIEVNVLGGMIASVLLFMSMECA